ncbi:uncharacterized protein LOC144673105 [Cetorhinus maximus]
MGKLVLVVLWALSLCEGMEYHSHWFVPRSLQEITRTVNDGNFAIRSEEVAYATDSTEKSERTWSTGCSKNFNFLLQPGPMAKRSAPPRSEVQNHALLMSSQTEDTHLEASLELKGRVTVPFDDKVISIHPYGIYTRILNRKHTISLTWNHQDALLLTLDSSYKGQLCGLCGKFEDGTKTIYGQDFLDANKLDILGNTCYSKPTKESSCPINPKCKVPISYSFSSCFENQIAEEYVKMCSADLCTCKELKCECATLEELARQCSKELFRYYKDWRTQTECEKPKCSATQIYKQCGPVCIPTCSNPKPQLQCDLCVDTCDCPEGTVLDNIRGRNTCIKKAECPCEHDGEIYESGQTKTTSCQSCTCESGTWSCSHLKCRGRCKIEEATCVTTFDNNYYCMIGECSYYAVSTEDWTIMVEIHQCQAAFKQSCLQRVTLTKNQTSFVFTNDGKIRLDQNVVTMPLRTGGITIFQQSSMYIQVGTTFGLKMQVQIFPIMQLYISLSEDLKESTKGLCGVFNDNAEDDFLSQGGIVESTPITFANSWKFKDSCPDAIIPPPCISSENEKYAKDNCRSIKDPNGPFSKCHSAVDSVHYYEMCVAATCACENINECLCAGLGLYVHECAAHGIIVKNWRRNICNTPCANTQVFENDMRACNRTCRSLSQYDYTCEVRDVPVYGCGCPEGKYMDNTGACIDKSDCLCYIDGVAIKKGQSIPLNGRICMCENGKPYCSTVPATTIPGCLNGKVYFDCRNVDNFCAKTCKEYNKPCSNSNCVPGCVCPDNLVEDDSGRCVAPEQCPCSFGGESYAPGITILRDCNNCTCKAGTWECTKNSCPKDCLVYGDGHYVTFDGKRYSFDGNCEYTLVEDRCNQGKGTIQILIESIPCCERGVTCSRIIRILFEDKELKLTDGRVIRTANSHGQTQCADDSYSLHTVGLYLILTFSNGITVIWDKRTRVSITLDPRWKNKICGLCGNFNGDVVDDVTTKGNSVVANVLEFGNSWKSTMSCSNAVNQTYPCDRNPYCLAWAQRKCSIMKDTVFQACHKKVDPTPFYEACVQEACACDLEGKHLGFCTAVAVYGEACNKAGVCIRWRTPDLCPVYCDYYNNPDECSWHYHPCGTLTTKTCLDHYVGKKFSAILEGCYAKCPVSAPYLDENIMKCVKLPDCTCYYNGQILQPGEVTRNDCEEWGKIEKGGGIVGVLKDKMTSMLTEDTMREGVTTTITLTTTKFTPVTTAPKGTTTSTAIERTTTTKVTSTSTVPTTVSTASSTAVSTTTQERTTTPVTEKTTTAELVCHGKWSPWINEHTPSEDSPGDFELLDPKDNEYCTFPTEVITNIQCRFVDQPERPISESPDNVTCDKDKGLTCVVSKSAFEEKRFCFDYQVRICCEPVSPVSTTSTSTTSTSAETTTPRATTTTSVSGKTTTIGSSSDYCSGPSEGVTTTVKATTTGSTTGSTQEVTTPSTVTTTVSRASSTTEVVCHGKWTPWINEHTPSEDSPGDFELLNPKDNEYCSFPSEVITNIQCQFVDQPERPISESPDNVTCDKDKGLNCEVSKSAMEEKRFCFDYQVRICCEPVSPVSTTSTSATSTSVSTTKQETTTTPVTEKTTTAGLTSTVTPTTTGSTTGSRQEVTTTRVISTATSSTPGSTPEVTTPSTVTTTVSRASSTTEVVCHGKWTPWINEHTPSEDSPGDFELLNPKDNEYCSFPSEVITNIQCQFVDQPERPISESPDNVTCDKDKGLNCEVSKSAMEEKRFCFDYQVRICCEPVSPVSTTSTSATSTSAVSTTKQETTTTPVTEKTTTAEGLTSTVTPTTTGSTTEMTTTRVISTATSSTPGSTPEVTTPSTVTTTVPRASSTTEVVCHGKWTPWINEHTPSEDSPGDFELLNPKDNEYCSFPSEVITNIQCQFVDQPERPISESPDNVTCDKDKGLNCEVSKSAMEEKRFCFDYQVRICCEPVSPVSTTSTSATSTSVSTTKQETTTTPVTEKTTTAGLTSTVTPTTTGSTTGSRQEMTTTRVISTATSSTPGSTPEVTTPSTVTTTVSRASSTTEVVCHGKWTPWINEHTPSEDSPGDFELLNPKDNEYCSFPSEVITNIQCQFVDQPERPISESPDNVTCDKDKGLNCEVSKSAMEEKRFCFDYQVRICCEPVSPVSTTSTSATSTSVSTTKQETTTTPVTEKTTTAGLTTTVTPTTTGSTTGSRPEVTTTRVISTATSSTPGSTPEVTTPSTVTTTVPRASSTTEVVCHGKWTPWINEHTPSEDSPDDFELLNPKDNEYCSFPSEVITNIQCQFVDQPERPISESPDNVTCDKDKGLNCEVSKSAMEEKRFCFDYQVRICCEPVSPVSTTSTSATSTSAVSTTKQETTTTPVTEKTTTAEGLTSTVTPTTTGSTTGSRQEVTTTRVISTATSSTPGSTPEVTTPSTVTTTVSRASSTTAVSTTKQETTTTPVTEKTTTAGLTTTVTPTTTGSTTGSRPEVTTTRVISTATSSTPGSTPEVTTPSTVTTTVPRASSTTEVVCHGKWTPWINEHTPSEDSPGDFELLNPKDNEYCSFPSEVITNIQCQFVDQPERPISESPDNVTCDKDKGLNCEVSKSAMEEKRFCFDYQVRICCEPVSPVSTTSTSATSTSAVSTTKQETTTTPVTEKTTTAGLTSTVTPTTTGSTTGSRQEVTTTRVISTATSSTPGSTPEVTTPSTVTTTVSRASSTTAVSTTKQETTTTPVTEKTTTAGLTTTVTPTTTGSTTGSRPEVTTTRVISTATSSTPGSTPEVTTPSTVTTTVPRASSTTEVVCHGKWTPWINEHTPSEDSPGDFELLNPKDNEYCSFPSEVITNIQCQFVDQPERPISESPDNVTCDKDKGLNCEVSKSAMEEKRFCFDYQVRICCEPVSPVSTTSTSATSTSAVSTTKQETTTTPVTEKTTTAGLTSTVTPTTTGSTTGSRQEVTTTRVISTATSSTPGSTPEVTTPSTVTTTVSRASSTTAVSTTKQETTTTPVTEKTTTAGLTTTVTPTTTGSTTGSRPEVTTTRVISTATSSTPGSTPEVTTPSTVTTTVPRASSTTAVSTTKQETTTTPVTEKTTTAGLTSTVTPTTTGSTTGSRQEVTTTRVISTATSSTPGSTPEVTTPSTVTTTVSRASSTTEVVCHGKWTPWINEHTPSEDSPGDFELLNPKDNEYCSFPSEVITNIQCQFVDQPERPISESPDNVTCDKDKGLNCEVSKSAMEEKRFCFDYQVRICCEPVSPVSTTSTSATSTSAVSTTKQETTTTPVTEKTTTAGLTSTVTPTTTGSTTGSRQEVTTTRVISTATSSTPGSTPEVTTPSTVTTTVSRASSTTEVVCHGKWTPWINEHTPSEDSPGDFELLNPKDNEYCSFPSEVITNIQCQFVDQPERPISESPDNVTCDKDKGLNCEVSKSAMEEKRFCFDYQVRICCEPVSPVSTTSTSATSTSAVSTTKQETTTTPVTEKTTTAEGLTTTVTPTTTGSTTGSRPEVTTTRVISTATSSTPGSTPEVTTPSTVTTTVPRASSTTEGLTTIVTPTTTGSTTGSRPEVTTTRVISTATSSTPGSTPEVTTPSTVTTTVSRASSPTVSTTKQETTTTPVIEKTTTAEGLTTIVTPVTTGSTTGSTPEVTTTSVKSATTSSTPGSTPGGTTSNATTVFIQLITKTTVNAPQYRTRTGSTTRETTTAELTSGSKPVSTTQETTTTPVTEKTTTAEGLTTTVKPTTTGSTTGSRPEVTTTTVKSATTRSTPGSTPEVPTPSTVTTTVSTAGSTTELVCHGKWSPWINEHTPSEGSPGDFELLDPKHNEYCSFPTEVITNIQCQFVDQPERPISESPDNVTCDKDKGLNCEVSQSALEEKRFCSDYQVRICCEPVSPVSTTTTSTTSTSVSTTAQETTTTPVIEKTTTAEGVTTTVKPTTTGYTTGSTPEVTTTTMKSATTRSTPGSTPEVPTPSTVTTTVSTAGSTTELVCHGKWSPWINEHTPSEGSPGDFELLDPKHNEYCSFPTEVITNIQCQFVDQPERPISESPDNVTCDKDKGLNCEVSQSALEEKRFCSDYQVRICCEPVSPVSTTTTSTTSTSVSTTAQETTTTPVIEKTTTAEGVTTTVKPTTTGYTTGSTPEGVTTTVKPTSTGYTTGSTPEVTTTSVKSTTSRSTTSSTPEVPTPSTVTTTVSTASSPTEVICNGAWSDWFNGKTPSIFDKNDSELLEPIRDKLCPVFTNKISHIECEAVKFPQRPISETKDNVTCDVEKGLICSFNEETSLNAMMCLDYRIRVCCESVTPSTPSTVYPTSIISSTKVIPACYCNRLPHRKCNETWEEGCSKITCLGKDIYSIVDVTCPSLQNKPTCSNGIEPVKVRTKNGCCEKWECDCECEVWGDPHYRTFNGLQYDFFENCTYILVEEQVPKYNFKILLDNYFCWPSVPKSCPKGLIIFYNGNTVAISTGDQYVLTVNKKEVSLPYKAKGFEITDLGRITNIFIPDIRTSITALRNNFRIRVPEQYFFNNTQGQCGSCSHSQSNCTRKDGTVEPPDCCSSTAYDWRVDDPNKPYCSVPPPNVPCIPTTPAPTCRPEKTVCDIIGGKPFEQCRKKINLDKYTKTCHFDHCQTNSTVDCTSLETAAMACASIGICVNWRPFTNKRCDYTCRRDLVYKPCQGRRDDRCVNNTVQPGTKFSPAQEGCFCPDGKKLSEDSTHCVASCKGCKARPYTKKIVKDDCEANVNVNQCEGECFSTTKFNFDTNALTHNCQCCHERETEEKSVKLQCRNGATRTYKYIDIKSCMCQGEENEKGQQLQ